MGKHHPLFLLKLLPMMCTNCSLHKMIQREMPPMLCGSRDYSRDYLILLPSMQPEKSLFHRTCIHKNLHPVSQHHGNLLVHSEDLVCGLIYLWKEVVLSKIIESENFTSTRFVKKKKKRKKNFFS